MEVELFTICKSVEDSNGKLSIHGIFNTIDVTQVPITTSFCVVARIRYYQNEFGEHDFQLLFGSPSGQITSHIIHHKFNVLPPSKFDFLVNFTLDTLINDIHFMTFKEYGVHHCAILIDGKQIGTRPFIVSPILLDAK